MPSICLRNGTVLTGVAAMPNCAVLIENGLVADVFSEKRLVEKSLAAGTQMIDMAGAYIAPGFIDTHIHGLEGYGTEDGTTEAVLRMSKALPKYGVTAFHPTLYPKKREDLISDVRSISAAIGKEDGARIMGLHLEGPFISPKMAGVQLPETMSEVDLDYMEEMWLASGGKIVNMTVAPELKHMRSLCLFCIKKGIVLQAGHTDAYYENMKEGMQAGILHATHLFNAMSKMGHRNPNAVGAVLIHSEVSCEIIADGAHVHPDLFKLLRRDKPMDKIVLVTDSLKPAEYKPPEGKPLLANGEEVVYHDGVFHRKSDDVIAGSALTMIRGVKNLVEFGFSLDEASKCASMNPANIMRHRNKGAIIPGYDADITVFDEDYNVKMTLVGGEIKYNAKEAL
jgi:N-acetylglucosamine-6-phosphate deacetylase